MIFVVLGKAAAKDLISRVFERCTTQTLIARSSCRHTIQIFQKPDIVNFQ